MNNCIFCNLKEGILDETENFLILAEKYPVVFGTILIVSKKHIACMAEISEEEWGELNQIIELVRKFFRQMYKTSLVWFEHGIAGQTIKHAHVHLVPLDSNYLLKKTVKLNDNPYEIEYFEEWQEFYQKNQRYYLLNQFNSLFLFKVNKAEKGFFRKLLARYMQMKDRADWKNYIDNEAEKEIVRLKENWKRWQVEL